MRGRVANVLVVLLLFFLGQNLHLCDISAERRQMSVIRVVAVVEIEISIGEEMFGWKGEIQMRGTVLNNSRQIISDSGWMYDGSLRLSSARRIDGLNAIIGKQASRRRTRHAYDIDLGSSGARTATVSRPSESVVGLAGLDWTLAKLSIAVQHINNLSHTHNGSQQTIKSQHPPFTGPAR